jgi:hypothetical protein
MSVCHLPEWSPAASRREIRSPRRLGFVKDNNHNIIELTSPLR